MINVIKHNKLFNDMATSAYKKEVKTVFLRLLEHVMVDRMASLGKIATNHSVHQQSRCRQIPRCILFNNQLK